MSMASTQEKKASLEGIVSRGDLRRLLDGSKYPRRFCPTNFDRELLMVANAAVESCVPTAIVLPLPGTKTPVLLAATMLIASFVRTEKLSSHVALVSKNIGLRRFYDSLFLKGDMLLGEYFPRTVVDAVGVAAEASELPPEALRKRGRLHFVPGAARLTRLRLKRSPSVIVPEGVVVESQACEENDLSLLLDRFGNKVPVVYLTVDPFDPILPTFRKRGAVWAWDAEHMASFAVEEVDDDAICLGAGILASAGSTVFEVASPEKNAALDTALMRLWEDLVEVYKNPFGPGLDATGWAWGAFNGLSQLVVPLEDYDRVAAVSWGTMPLEDAPLKAEAFGRNAVGEAREMWDILADDLEGAVEAARLHNPKPALVSRWIAGCMDENADGVVIVRNRASRKALESFLDEDTITPFGWRHRVSIATLSDVASGRANQKAPQALITGPLTSRHGWMLALPAAERVTVLAHGSWEGDRIVRQVERTCAQLINLARGDIREEAAHALFGTVAGASEISESRSSYVPEVVRSVAPDRKVPPAVASAVWSPFDVKVAQSVGRKDEESVDGMATAPDELSAEPVEVLLLEFEDGQGYFEPNCPVSRLSKGSVEDVATKSLRPGDRIVLVERGARRDLFTLIVKRLEGLPEMATVIMFVQEWHERAREAGQKSGLDSQRILARMGDTSIKHSSTVSSWIRGAVHGPNKAEDIRRFGQAVGDDFLASEWELMGKALRTIRGHRIKMGKMLNSAISGMSPADREDGGYFDRRLGIHYSDLADAVSVHTVTSVAASTVTVSGLQANKLSATEEDTVT